MTDRMQYSEDSPKTRGAKAAAAKAAYTARKRALKTVSRTKPRGFMDFIRDNAVVGLAIGLVLGTQMKVLVDTLIASFINPILGIVLPGTGDLSQKKFVFDAWGKTAVFAWGQFAYVLLSFLVVLLVIYYIVKGLKLHKLDKKKD